MRVILCSSHLERQQQRAEGAAGAALRQPISRPGGFWRRLAWWLTGRELTARLARLEVARAHEGDALRYARGREGEELLARVLGRQLDDRYTLLRNYTPHDDRRGDLDAVLLGPHGITSFEVKAWHGYYRVSGDTWFYRQSPTAGWRPTEKNPTAQALENARRLRAVLVRAGLGRIPIRPVVAVASARMTVELDPPLAVFVFFATRPQPRLAADLGSPVLDATAVRRVHDALLPRER